MNSEQALTVLKNVAEAANKGGLLTLNDSVTTAQALAVVQNELTKIPQLAPEPKPSQAANEYPLVPEKLPTKNSKKL